MSPTSEPWQIPPELAAEMMPAVIWPKRSFGTQSARGSCFAETLLTVIETRRQQNRPLFTFVTEAIPRHVAQQPLPSLFAGM